MFSRCGRLNRLHRINTVDTIDQKLNAPVGTTRMVGTLDRIVKSCSLMMTDVVESKECFQKATLAYQNVCGANHSRKSDESLFLWLFGLRTLANDGVQRVAKLLAEPGTRTDEYFGDPAIAANNHGQRDIRGTVSCSGSAVRFK